MPTWRGQLDFVNREYVAGWARDDERPDEPVELTILDNGVLLARLPAELFREDLRASGLGSGFHSFSLQVPGGFAPEIRHLVEVKLPDGSALPGSPFILGAAASGSVVRSAKPATWRGSLDIVTRRRIEGWAFHPDLPETPLALVILVNGDVLARVLANRYRDDLQNAGLGDGRHAFSFTIPGGLPPMSRHVIQVLGELDGCEMPGSPRTLEAATAFDPALEHAVTAAVTALATREERDRVLKFLADTTERLLGDAAEADSQREVRLIQKQFERRWGRGQNVAGVLGAPPPRPRALVVDDRVPVPSRDAGSIALLSHMRALQQLGFEVTLVASEELSPAPATIAGLEAYGIEVCCLPYYASVEEVLRRQAESFELVYLHRVSSAAKYLALARRYCPKARMLYSVADLHHLRLARQSRAESRPELLAQSRRLRMAECTAAAMASTVITHSLTEAAWLRQTVTGCDVHVVPWAVPLTPTSRPWSERRGIAFIGHFLHSPNLDAARYLAEHVLPRVAQADPAIECLLVGSGMPDSIARLARPGLVPVGEVPDLQAIYDRVRLVVAPLRFGAGIKGKVLGSLAAGIPCVMSPMAAEGMALPPALGPLVAPDEARMAAAIVRLHGNEAESRTLSQAGLAFIEAGYSESVVVAALKAAVEGRRAGAPAASAPTGGAVT